MNRKIILAIALLSIVSCASNKPELAEIEAKTMLNYQAFPNYKDVEIENVEEIYALNDEMKKFIDRKLIEIKDPTDRAGVLLRELFHRSPQELRYQNGADLTAQQAFSQNTANCLSLTILAYSLAKQANLEVKFQEVLIPEYWIRDGQYNMLTGHVNLVITGDRKSPYKVVWGRTNTTIDFDPYVVKKHFEKNVIAKTRITAMFYNNKGAQALVNNDYNTAFRYFEASIEQDPYFSSGWGNLALLYKKVGLLKYAEQAYLYAVRINPDNYNSWNNLAILLEEINRLEEASKINQFITSKRRSNPYYHALLGDDAYYIGDYNASIKHYKKARSMQPKEHEFYFGLARSYYKKGDYKTTDYYLSKAKKLAPFKDIKQKYQSKLALLSRL